MKTVILDVYGADAGPKPIITGAMHALNENSELRLIIVGDSAEIMACAEQENVDSSRFEIVHTTDFITNHEPSHAIFRGRDESSMAMAYERLKADDSCVGMLSAGSTGALLVGSIARLGLTAKLKTPALSSLLPCLNGRFVCLVDCGANVNCNAKDISQYALLGSDYYKKMYHVESPRVALLSVGREDSKGNTLSLECFSELSELPINFVGNMEGCDLITGYADVVVTDGFSGNILLKSTEAAGHAAMQLLEQQIADCKQKNASKETLDALENSLSKITDLFELNTRGGATFLGTKKPIIKMHGVATEKTVVACIEQLWRVL